MGNEKTTLEAAPESRTEQPDASRARAFWTSFKRFMNTYSIIYAVLILVVILSFIAPGFFSLDNFVNVLRQISMIAILAVGSFFVMVSGGIDISTGANVGLTGVIFSLMMVSLHIPPVLAVPMAICFGAMIGLVNGLIVTKLGIPAMIATLATQSVCAGATYVITNGYAISGLPESVLFLGKGYLFGLKWLPWPVAILLVVVVASHFVSQKTKYGRYLYAVGGNAEASYLSGIKDKQVQIWSYVICGGLAALAGVILT